MSERLYGHTIRVWQSVYHNGRFSHHNRRSVTVRLDRRRLKPEDAAVYTDGLKEGTEYTVGNLTVKTSDEWIYSVDYLGVATPRIVWDYHK